MNTYEEDLQYERKMDRISEELEEMILDAMVAALQKIRERNLHFSKIANQPHPEPFPF
jgi:arginine utilization protein RocB